MTHRRRILGRIWRSLELSDLWAWQKWGNGKIMSLDNISAEENQDPDGQIGTLDSYRLLFQVIPQLIHQLKNHLTVVQNAHFSMKKALEMGQHDRLERSSELGILGVQRAEMVIKTISLLESMDTQSILSHYQKRYSNSEVEIEYPHQSPIIDRFLAPLVCSLEYLRPRMIKGSRIIISVNESRIVIEQHGEGEVVAPPELNDLMSKFYRFIPADKGWGIENCGE